MCSYGTTRIKSFDKTRIDLLESDQKSLFCTVTCQSLVPFPFFDRLYVQKKFC